MLLNRLTIDDPVLNALEAVMLRSAFERLDDWLIWLDDHVATDHGHDDAADAVLQMLSGVRHRLAREIRLVDYVLTHIDE
jgi:hypothetical protein